jgi:hypothetical protein
MRTPDNRLSLSSGIMTTPMFSATIAVHDVDMGDILADRVASRNLTQSIPKRHDIQAIGRQLHYRFKILDHIRRSVSDPVHGEKLVSKFRNLAEALENERAVAIPADILADSAFHNAWRALLNDNTAYRGKRTNGHADDLEQNYACNKLLHPLAVALLAYRMGGPINAASTPHAHQWKLPDQSAPESDQQNIHMEGENECIFYDHRVTLVWEEVNGDSRGVSGEHHVFRSGEGSGSKPLKTASVVNQSQVAASTILYDQKNAALVYESQESDAVRHSLSLDFVVETTDDDILGLVGTPTSPQITLTELRLGYPMPGYSHHFHRLLFSPDSLGVIASKLSDINTVTSLPTCLPVQDQFLDKRSAWYQENQIYIPPDIPMEFDICISGYTSTAAFLHRLTLRARRDVHLRIGGDLFPQDAIEDNRECARRYIRDMPSTQVMERLRQYESALVTTPFIESDMLPTTQLHNLACKIEQKCWELMGAGFIDPTGVLESLPCFVSALGKALNGPKEIHRVATLQGYSDDLQIYRTRCLFLFWCADWLARYEPIPGLCMLPEADEVIRELRTADFWSDTMMLLRNWVAWGLFVESLMHLPNEFVVKRVA